MTKPPKKTKKPPKATRSIRFDVADLEGAEELDLDVSQICRHALGNAVRQLMRVRNLTVERKRR